MGKEVVGRNQTHTSDFSTVLRKGMDKSTEEKSLMIRARFREAVESSGHVDIFYNELLPRSGHELIFMLGFLFSLTF